MADSIANGIVVIAVALGVAGVILALVWRIIQEVLNG